MWPIYTKSEDIDSALAGGVPEIVDRIARVTVSGKKNRYYFSFATKYCSWHKPESCPIWDSRVDRYIHFLKGEPRFAEFFDTGEEYWSYPQFRRLITTFRDCYGVGSFSFKQIDKFLYLYGGK